MDENIYLCDENINNPSELNEKLDRYNMEVYKYLKLIDLYKRQIKVYEQLSIDFKTEAHKQKVILENYKKNVENIDKYICKICFENYCDCIVMPCMHFVCCTSCIQQITDNKCPMCRNAFVEYLKIFD